MKDVMSRPALALLLFLALGLGGCGDFEEMKSMRLLMQAETLLQQGDESQAEAVLTALVDHYPQTRSARAAGQHLEKIGRQRELRERPVFAEVIGSTRQVLDGYQAVYGEFPRSLASLGQSGYFFDAAYLEELVPSGYQVALQLGGGGYHIWCATADGTRGYSAKSGNEVPVRFGAGEFSNLREKFPAADWAGRFVELSAR